MCIFFCYWHHFQRMFFVLGTTVRVNGFLINDTRVLAHPSLTDVEMFRRRLTLTLWWFSEECQKRNWMDGWRWVGISLLKTGNKWSQRVWLGGFLGSPVEKGLLKESALSFLMRQKAKAVKVRCVFFKQPCVKLARWIAAWDYCKGNVCLKCKQKPHVHNNILFLFPTKFSRKTELIIHFPNISTSSRSSFYAVWAINQYISPFADSILIISYLNDCPLSRSITRLMKDGDVNLKFAFVQINNCENYFFRGKK